MPKCQCYIYGYSILIFWILKAYDLQIWLIKGIFVCFLLCNKHHNWEEKANKQKIGVVKDFIQVAYYGPSVREFRAEAQGRSLESSCKKFPYCCLPWLALLPFLYSSHPAPRDGTSHNGLGLTHQDNTPQTCPQANLMEEFPYLRLLLPRWLKFVLSWQKKNQLNLIEELLSKTILTAKLYHMKSYLPAIECIMKSKLCDSI